MPANKKKVALLHGAGYAGGEIIKLLASHPMIDLEVVTSRTYAGHPVWTAHPMLRGQTDLLFSDGDPSELAPLDGIFIAAEHGQGARRVAQLLAEGYEGAIVDLSADFRFKDVSAYETWFNFEHPAPELLHHFVYGLPEINGPYAAGTRYIANPGCFATGLTLALWPLAERLDALTASATALTGASGSGTRPKSTTHFPSRDGNVRAYKVLGHQHLPEVIQTLGNHADVAFVPVSGPWTRGIWGTAHIQLPEALRGGDITAWFETAYEDAPFVRLWPDALPELRSAVGTPFCDLGWVMKEGHLVVGFALDNLLKGAASQAVQNMNLILGLPEEIGLIPGIPYKEETVQLQPANGS